MLIKPTKNLQFLNTLINNYNIFRLEIIFYDYYLLDIATISNRPLTRMASATPSTTSIWVNFLRQDVTKMCRKNNPT